MVAGYSVCQRVVLVEFRREVLGEKHPDTISSMADLAATYHAQGRYDEVEGIYQQVLKVRREMPGEKHPDTISSMASLATTYHQQGRYTEAEQLHQTALDLRRRVLGESHPATIQSIEYLALTQEALQQFPSHRIPAVFGSDASRQFERTGEARARIFAGDYTQES
jgi:tetratricopeptide (TPR) repeat protein